MSEDCKQCCTMMWLLDSEGLCPACNGLGFDENGEPIYEDDYDRQLRTMLLWSTL